MFVLKIILRNVQRIDVTSQYVQKVIVDKMGKKAMELACRVASDAFFTK